jgi:hypothetical protein
MASSRYRGVRHVLFWAIERFAADDTLPVYRRRRAAAACS